MNINLIILYISTIFFFFGFIFLFIFSSSYLTIEKMKSSLSYSIEKKIPIVSTVSYLMKKYLFSFYYLLLITKFIALIVSTILIFHSINIFSNSLLFSLSFTLIIFVFSNLFAQIIGKKYINKTIYFSSMISSIYIYIFYPISIIIFWIFNKLARKHKNSKKIINLLHDININEFIDKKLLNSLLTFKEKVAREVMIPRIKILSLSDETSIKKAAFQIIEKGYSRIPVYHEKADNIIGILMYKDILKEILKNKINVFDKSIKELIKPVIYIPENKKISSLFQEFRKEKKHIAIVVNEYGIAEGIITIEDILEELVGEIQDEHDISEEKNIWTLPDGSYLVDAKISIIDLEKILGIALPHNPEYETIGGFIFHKAGEIPAKGWVLYLDEYEFKVVATTDKSIERIKILPKKEELDEN